MMSLSGILQSLPLSYFTWCRPPADRTANKVRLSLLDATLIDYSSAIGKHWGKWLKLSSLLMPPENVSTPIAKLHILSHLQLFSTWINCLNV